MESAKACFSSLGELLFWDLRDFVYLLLRQASIGDHSYFISIGGTKLQPKFQISSVLKSKTWTESLCWSRSKSKKFEGFRASFDNHSQVYYKFNILGCKLLFDSGFNFLGLVSSGFFTLKLICFISFPRSSYLILYNFSTTRYVWCMFNLRST